MKMNLIHAENTVIGEGDRIRGISGGEKRRLSFAAEVGFLLNSHFIFDIFRLF
jgi:ABC-type multidrug transport system ATPase subunit